ncbi:MAG: aminopeptidase N [Actinomycetaceae bacterium]|nr:aminopeptidase N [Actinomycetaceae bacterium]
MSFLSKSQAHTRSQTLEVTRIRVNLDLRDPATTDTTTDTENLHAPTALDTAQTPEQPQTYHARSVIFLTSSDTQVRIDVAAININAVTLDGQDASYQQHDEYIVVDNVPVDEKCKIIVDATMAYSHDGQGLHRFIDSEDGRVYCYTHFEPADAHRAWPCFDQPDIKPVWEFHVHAPTNWIVRSNRSEISDPDNPTPGTWEFGTTEPLPAYLTAVIAGQWYVHSDGEWKFSPAGGPELSVPLTFLCRHSLKKHLDTADLSQVTRQGLDFYHKRYNFAYPWGKYDQVFVPQFNIGAMENPGLVTFNDNYIYREHSTRAQRQQRALTVLHEMCHMWFGDLVTPRWWDDLWLKESFADHEALCALEATRYTTGWATFALGREIWAYDADACSTTHPIVAQAETVEQAQQNFDGITYAKGAAVVKQFVAWLGHDIFVRRMRTYFARYAFATATSQDFFTVLSAGDPTMEQWTQAWLKTAGITALTVTIKDDDLHLHQECADPVTGQPVLRPLAFTIAFWNVDDNNRLTRNETTQIEFAQQITTTPRHSPLFVLNEKDEAYAVVHLPDTLYRDLSQHVASLPSPLTRARVWQTLYQGVRYQWLHPQKFIETVLEQAKDGDATLLPHLGSHVIDATFHMPSTLFRTWNKTIAKTAFAYAKETRDSDSAQAWAQTAAHASAYSGESAFADDIHASMQTLHSIDRQWECVCALSALGQWSTNDIVAFYRRYDHTSRGRRRALEAMYANESTRAQARELLLSPPDSTNVQTLSGIARKDLSNDDIRSVIEGLAWHRQRGSSADIGDMIALWSRFPQHLANHVVAGMYPGPFFVDHDAHDIINETKTWLNIHVDTSAQLQRIVSETYEKHLRRYRSQLKWWPNLVGTK